jgi:hypothetical protein
MAHSHYGTYYACDFVKTHMVDAIRLADEQQEAGVKGDMTPAVRDTTARKEKCCLWCCGGKDARSGIIVSLRVKLDAHFDTPCGEILAAMD